MTEEKDDFLREIDELLQGDSDIESEEHVPSTSDAVTLANISSGVADLDLNSTDGGLTQGPAVKKPDSNLELNGLQQKAPSPPKTGKVKLT